MRVRAVLLAAAVLAAAPCARAGEVDPKERAFVEIRTPRTTVYVGETVALTLRVGVDEAWFAAHATPFLARPLEVPVHVTAPAFDAWPGTRALPDRARREAVLRRFALDDRSAGEAAPDETRQGRTFRVATYERRFVVEREGPLAVPGARLRFVHAERFEDDLVRGRVAVDPREAVIESAPLAFEARALPSEGRPAGFRGAVGRFALRARADRTEVAVGEIFRLSLALEGSGPLGDVVLPRADDAPGFHVYGVRDDHADGLRTAISDVAALSSDVRALPPLTLPYFDPDAGGFAVARTEPIPLTVHPAPAGAPPPSPGPSTPPWTWVLAACVALALAVSVAVQRRRDRGPHPGPS